MLEVPPPSLEVERWKASQLQCCLRASEKHHLSKSPDAFRSLCSPQDVEKTQCIGDDSGLTIQASSRFIVRTSGDQLPVAAIIPGIHIGFSTNTSLFIRHQNYLPN